MKPRLVKEVGRVTKSFGNPYISDLHFAQFKIQVENSNDWQKLVIFTTKDFRKAISYVLNGQKFNDIETHSWVNALLQTTNTSKFDEENLKEFYLEDDCSYRIDQPTNRISFDEENQKEFYLKDDCSHRVDQPTNLLLLICKTAAIITIAASLIGLIVASAVLTGGLAVLGIAAFSVTSALGIVGFYKVKAEQEQLAQPGLCEPCYGC